MPTPNIENIPAFPSANVTSVFEFFDSLRLLCSLKSDFPIISTMA
jgi:hypothetical protein